MFYKICGLGIYKIVCFSDFPLAQFTIRFQALLFEFPNHHISNSSVSQDEFGSASLRTDGNHSLTIVFCNNNANCLQVIDSKPWQKKMTTQFIPSFLTRRRRDSAYACHATTTCRDGSGRSSSTGGSTTSVGLRIMSAMPDLLLLSLWKRMKGRDTFAFRCHRRRNPAACYSISVWISLTQELSYLVLAHVICWKKNWMNFRKMSMGFCK